MTDYTIAGQIIQLESFLIGAGLILVLTAIVWVGSKIFKRKSKPIGNVINSIQESKARFKDIELQLLKIRHVLADFEAFFTKLNIKEV